VAELAVEDPAKPQKLREDWDNYEEGGGGGGAGGGGGGDDDDEQRKMLNPARDNINNVNQMLEYEKARRLQG